MSTDGELVERIGAGDRAAEHAFVARFAPRVRLYGLRHLRDEDRARDLVQSVLLAVLEALRSSRVKEIEKVERFVLGTCRNVVLRMREIEARAQPAEREELEGIAAEDVIRVEVGPLLHCLGALEERARQVVHFTFQEERSAGEIAALLSMTTGNVRVVRHRAVAALRKCLDGQEVA
ncbi:MAG: RNA polymerase sigma factor [Polyangiales bacterium]